MGLKEPSISGQFDVTRGDDIPVLTDKMTHTGPVMHIPFVCINVKVRLI